MNYLKLKFGCLAAPVIDQIKDQGYKCDVKVIKLYQRQINVILELSATIISDKERIKFFRKIFKLIIAHVRSINKKNKS